MFTAVDGRAMRAERLIVLAAFLLFANVLWSGPEEERADPVVLELLVPEDVIRDYEAFLGERDPLKVVSYAGSEARRDVVELLLWEQALATGGAEAFELKWVPMRSYKLIVESVGSGKYLAAGTSVWRSDAAERGGELLRSSPLIRDGEFLAGFYALAENREIRAVKSLGELRQFAGISNRHWSKDWARLEELELCAFDVGSWSTMVAGLGAGIADFTLAPFNSRENMAIRHESITLEPIPGLKTHLPGERIFIVSATHPHGEAVFAALERGLAKMRADGTIERAYRECGFFNEAVRYWKAIMPAAVED